MIWFWHWLVDYEGWMWLLMPAMLALALFLEYWRQRLNAE
jgi:hypothetical protein